MAVKLGMNVNQSLVFDLLTRSPIWATPIEIDGEYYWWVSRQSICRELELLKMKPDTAYRHLKALADLKLISYKKEGLKDCIAITELGKSYVGNKSEESRKQIREGSEIIPIYPTSSNNTTSILYTPGFEKFWDVYPKHKTDKKGVFKKWNKQNLEPMADELVADVLLRINESEKWGPFLRHKPRLPLRGECLDGFSILIVECRNTIFMLFNRIHEFNHVDVSIAIGIHGFKECICFGFG